MTGNAGAIDQARAYADAGVEIARLRIGDLLAARPGRTTLQGGWLGASQVLPMVGGVATARVTDGGNCFNLNSVVAGESARSAAHTSELQSLMRISYAVFCLKKKNTNHHAHDYQDLTIKRQLLASFHGNDK